MHCIGCCTGAVGDSEQSIILRCKHSRRSWARYVSVGVQTLADKSEQNGDLDPLSRSGIFVKRKKKLERLLFDTVVVAFSWHARILGEMLTNHLLFACCCFLFCFFK